MTRCIRTDQVLFFLVLFLFPGLAVAEESAESDQAQECVTFVDASDEQNFRRLTFFGVTCFEAQKFDWALTHYLRAFELNPDPMLRAAMGRTLHEMGLYDPALYQYERFLQTEGQSSSADRIRRRVEELKSAMEDDTATVALRSTPVDARAYLVLDNGKWFDLGETPTEVRLREGVYQFAIAAEGYYPRQRRQQIHSGHTRVVESELVPASALFNVSARNWRRAGAWTMGISTPVSAAGITLLALSVQNTSAARELENDFDDLSDFDSRRRALLDDAASYRFWGTVVTGVGATGLIVGALLKSTPSQTPPPAVDATSPQPPLEELPKEDLEETAFLPSPAPQWELEALVNINQVGLRLRF